MKMNIKGLDEALNSLRDLQNRAQRLEGTHSVPVTELLTSQFMQQNTRFQSFDEMVSASGFKVEFRAIPDDEWDAFIARETKYANWQSMLEEAGQEWAKRQLGL